MQALKVIIGVLILGISALSSLRFYGLGQTFQVFDHPILKQPRPWILAWGGDLEAGLSHSRSALQAAKKLEGVILAVNVEMTADKHFFVVPPGLAQQQQGQVLSQLRDGDVQALDLGGGQGPQRLEQFLIETAPMPVLLWIRDNIENIDLRLRPILERHANESRILIHSEYDNVVKSIKKLFPQFLYGTGVGQRVRLVMLSSLWLEPVAAIDGDLLISPLRERGVRVVNPALISEVERRQKLFIIGPLNDSAANEQGVSIQASGYLTSYPNDMKNKILQRSTGVDLSKPAR
jgi:hypothetical protein